MAYNDQSVLLHLEIPIGLRILMNDCAEFDGYPNAEEWATAALTLAARLSRDGETARRSRVPVKGRRR